MIATGVCSPWLLMGDFNALSNMDDIIGATVRHGEIAPMLECLNHCKLYDVKTSRRHFTWNNKQEGNRRVFSRIDRALANAEWIDKYDMAEVVCLPEGTFDHTPLLLYIYPDIGLKRPFKSTICGVLILHC